LLNDTKKVIFLKAMNKRKKGMVLFLALNLLYLVFIEFVKK